jgi:hypothetical protein
MSDHKTLEGEVCDLESLLSSKEVLRRLLRSCEPCRESVQRGLTSLNAAARGKAEAPELSSAYDAVLDRAVDHLVRAATLPEGERQRFYKAASLLRSGDGVLAIAQTGKMSVEGLGVFEALLARSWAIRYDNHREMSHLARVAVEMSEGFDADTYGVVEVADLRARAWGELANAYRVADRLREAEMAFGKAFDFFQQGSGDRSLQLRNLARYRAQTLMA